MTDLLVTTSFEDDVCLVRLDGEARVETIQQFERAVDESEERDIHNVLVDMSLLSFMDSASTGSLLRIHGRLERAGGVLVLYDLQRRIARLLDRLGLTQLRTAIDLESARAQVT